MAAEARITIRDLPGELTGDEMQKARGGYRQVPPDRRKAELTTDTWSGTWPGLVLPGEARPVRET